LTGSCDVGSGSRNGARHAAIRIVRRQAAGFGSSGTEVVCCPLKAVFGSGFGNLAVPVVRPSDFGLL